MKSKLILASALLISVAAFAQKDEIKAAEKALKGGAPAEAINILNGAASLIANAENGQKAQYYFVQGNAYLELANKKIEEGKNLSLAAKSFQQVKEIEKASGKEKYSAQVKTSISDVKYKLINSAIADSKADKNLIGAAKLYDAYLLDKKDTINLYYAASSYIAGKDYANALKLYEKLKELNYSGKGTSYIAVSKVSGQENLFNTAKERDDAIKLGTHEKPKTEVVPSKRGEIYKNIGLILVQDGKIEEAKKAMADARKANPEDASLILSEANLYLETKDYDTYKKLITEVLEKKPNDAELVFNLGVISANAKNSVDAEKYYKRAIEIDPKYINAYINLAVLKLEGEKVLNDEMSKIPPGKNEKRYDELYNKKKDLYRSIIPYLEKAVELDPVPNGDAAKTLVGVYNALDMTAEYKALKEKIKAAEAKK